MLDGEVDCCDGGWGGGGGDVGFIMLQCVCGQDGLNGKGRKEFVRWSWLYRIQVLSLWCGVVLKRFLLLREGVRCSGDRRTQIDTMVSWHLRWKQ